MSDSWYVETLLRNRDIIRSDIIEYEQVYDDTVVYTDFDNDDYNNLLLIEQTLKTLIENNQLSKKEAIIINEVLTHKSLSQIERETGMTRVTVAKFFEGVCDRIAFILGGCFTDEGYLESLALKYNLNSEQIEKARTYMNSNKRYYSLKKET